MPKTQLKKYAALILIVVFIAGLLCYLLEPVWTEHIPKKPLLHDIMHLSVLELNGDDQVEKRLLTTEDRRSELLVIRISNAKLDSKKMQFIGSCQNLDELKLFNVKIEGNDFLHLLNCQKLRTLSIYSNSLSDEPVKRLHELKQLVFLGVGGLKLTDQAFVNLGKLENLQYFHIVSSQVNGSGLAHLSNNKKLMFLSLGDSPKIKDESMVHVSQMQSVGMLGLRGTSVTDIGLAAITGNYQITSLTPSSQMTDKGILAFRKALLKNRTVAKNKGEQVPGDNELLIQKQ